jgi:hypothetical protein
MTVTGSRAAVAGEDSITGIAAEFVSHGVSPSWLMCVSYTLAGALSIACQNIFQKFPMRNLLAKVFRAKK